MFINILNIWPGLMLGILHFYSICHEEINVSLIIKKKLEFYGSVRVVMNQKYMAKKNPDNAKSSGLILYRKHDYCGKSLMV